MRSERHPHAALSGRAGSQFLAARQQSRGGLLPGRAVARGHRYDAREKIDANTSDFDLKKDGKVVGHVHRVVSADGKTLTVHNTGMQVSGTVGDETLVFDKQ
jgi:hypothetical protein